MSLRRRALLGVIATAVQVAGCLVVFRSRHSIPWVLVIVGFYLSSWLALASGEILVGASRDPRKRGIAVLTTTGLVGSYSWIDHSLRTGQSFPLVFFLCMCLSVNLLGSLLLVRPRRQVTPEVLPAAADQSRRNGWVRGGAGLVAAGALLFVGWRAAVVSVSLTYAVEPRLIGDLRTLASAQAAYATVNSGFYDTLECLQTPSRCLPNYSTSAPVFLEPGRWSGTLGYFRRRFIPGAGVDPKELPAGASPTSIRTFAYIAVPAEPGGLRGFIWRRAGLSLEGVRSFCADSTGRICVSDGSAEPRVVEGVCSPECQSLQ
jgi:hypothetical protein